MIVLELFLALLWALAVFVVLVGGVWSVRDVASWGGVTRRTMATGIAIRLVLAAAILAQVIGWPLVWIGWA